MKTSGFSSLVGHPVLKDRIRLVIGVFILLFGLGLGWNLGSTTFWKSLLAMTGICAPLCFYGAVIILIQKDGYTEEFPAYYFGFWVGITSGFFYWVTMSPLKITYAFLAVIIGVILGLFWTKLNILYYFAADHKQLL